MFASAHKTRFGASRKLDTASPVPHYNQEQTISLEEMYTDGRTAITKKGSLVSVVELKSGEDTMVASEKLMAHLKQKKAFFESLEEGIILRVVTCKTQSLLHPCGEISGNALIKTIQARHRESFSGVNYITQTFLVFEQRHQPILKKKTGIASKNYAAEKHRLAVRVMHFSAFVDRMVVLLRDYLPEILYQQATVQFFMRRYNGGKIYAFPTQGASFTSILSSTSWEFDTKEKMVTFHHPNKGQHSGAILSIKKLPDDTYHALLDTLHRLPCEMEIAYLVIPADQEANKQKVNRKIHALYSQNGYKKAELEELDEAGNQIAFNKLQFHEYALTVFIYGDSRKDLEDKVREAYGALTLSGVTPIREGWNLHACFYGRQPDCEAYLVARIFTLTTENLSHMVRFGGVDEGIKKNAFGNHAVCPVRLLDGQAYYFSFQPDQGGYTSGHTALFAPTGAGKSTVMMFLLHHCLNYPDFKALIFDAGKGVKVPVLCGGGTYNVIGDNDTQPIKMNPFMALENTPANREFLANWLKRLAGIPLMPEQENLVMHMVTQCYGLEKEDRSLHSIRAFLTQGKKGDGRFSSAFQKWLPNEEDPTQCDSPYARYFNNSHDDLVFDHRIVAYDMDAILGHMDNQEDNVLLGAVSSYIFHKFKTLADMHPFPHIVFIDESRAYIEDPLFSRKILDLAQKQRKKMGVLVLAGQDPSILVEHDGNAPFYTVKKQILQNIETFLIWPNANAREEDYRKGISLTDKEFEWVKTSHHKYHIMVKRARTGQSVIVNMDLSYLSEYLKVYNSSTKNIASMEAIMRGHREGWEQHYINACKG